MSSTRLILSIGYRSYLLPASANINVIMKSLAGAVSLDSKYHDGENWYFPKETLTVKIETVQSKFVVDGKRKMIPEKCGPPPMEEELL